VGNDSQFRSLCAALGQSAMAQDPRFATNALRVANREALTAHLAPLIEGRATAQWLQALESAGVPCGPINDIAQVFDTPQAKSRELVVTQSRADLAHPIRSVASPMRLSATPPSYERPAPVLGADTAEVLQDRLGLSEEQIEALGRQGAI
jgi:crotonobetainyl-CoA:carnitine CoA-transferase CaiB-like acyl-CoA transferase